MDRLHRDGRLPDTAQCCMQTSCPQVLFKGTVLHGVAQGPQVNWGSIKDGQVIGSPQEAKEMK